MSAIDNINAIRALLGMKPLVAAADTHFKEWEHPRDKNGRWIEKLSFIKWLDEFAGVIESLNRDGTVTARITHTRSEDNRGSVGTRVRVDPADIETLEVKADLNNLRPTPIIPRDTSKEAGLVGDKPWTPARPVLTGDIQNLGDISTWKGLREALRGKDLVVFDTETTGLDVGPDGADSPIEIGAVKMRDGKVIDKFHTYIKHDSVPDVITQITGITADQLVDAPDIATAGKAFRDWVKADDNTVLVAHNANFDLDAIDTMADLPDDIPVLDTLSLSRAVMPKSSSPVSNHRLGTLAAYFGVNLDNAHTADADALATGELIDPLLNWAIQEKKRPDALKNSSAWNDQFDVEMLDYRTKIQLWRDSQTTQDFK